MEFRKPRRLIVMLDSNILAEIAKKVVSPNDTAFFEGIRDSRIEIDELVRGQNCQVAIHVCLFVERCLVTQISCLAVKAIEKWTFSTEQYPPRWNPCFD